MAFEDLGENMTKKMGPFPVWVWGVLIGGAFVVWYWVSQRDAGSSALADAVEDAGGTAATPSGDFSTVPVIPTEPPIEDENTNGEWMMQALNAVGNTGVSLLAAQTALSKYLNGEHLTAAEGVLVDKALKLVGPPPEGVNTPDVTPTPDAVTPSHATKTTVSGAGTRLFGQSSVIYVKTRWVDPKGHVGNPSGNVSIFIDDVQRAKLRLINGDVVYVTTARKGMASTQDKRWVVRAVYHGDAGKANKSDSNTLVITLS